MADGTIWREIEATLRREIVDGQYAPGEKLPTEAALATRFGVNRHTIRRALAELHAAGLTHARRGAGVFVTSRPTIYPIGSRVRFHQSLEAAGHTPRKEILRLETVTAAAREGEALDLSPGSRVHVWEGIGFADGVPVTLFRSWFPADRLPGLPESLSESRSVTVALAAEGVADYVRRSTELTAERAGPLQARHLRVAEGAPLLCSVAVNVDPAGRPVEFGRTWFAGERVRLVIGETEQA